MSWLDFIASVISAVAWPLVALFALILLRQPLARLLTDRPPKRVKVGPLDVEWTREIAEAETELSAAGTPLPPGPDAASLVSELETEARKAPAIAVLEAYAVLDRELRNLVESKIDVPSDELIRNGPLGLARLAARHGVISQETANAVQSVSVLRNLAAHGSARDVTTDQAIDYLALVDGVLLTLREQDPPV
jgi:hypothetical protein